MVIIQISEGYFSNITKIGFMLSWKLQAGWIWVDGAVFWVFQFPAFLAYQKCNLLNVRGGPPIPNKNNLPNRISEIHTTFRLWKKRFRTGFVGFVDVCGKIL